VLYYKQSLQYLQTFYAQILMYLRIYLCSYIVLMFTKSLKMIKIDQNMSEIQQIVCTKYNFNISLLAGFIV
jgi:hypothetical protein